MLAPPSGTLALPVLIFSPPSMTVLALVAALASVVAPPSMMVLAPVVILALAVRVVEVGGGS